MTRKAGQARPNHLLRAARKKQDWTQQFVADQIGAPLALNVTRWERGTSIPSLHYAQRLCQLFGMSPQELGLLPIEDEIQYPYPPSPHWNVPYPRNPFFTGREDILTHLEDYFSTGRTVALTQSYALSGLGGIGKTQIAVEYAYRKHQNYQSIFWIRAANPETLTIDFVALAQLLNLPERDVQDQQAILAAVKLWLTHHQGWLLILDNADDLALVADFLPEGETGHLLLTTRAQATGKIAVNIAVEKMEQSEACLLLLRRAKRIAPTASLDTASSEAYETALKIVQLFDGLPLALDQAGAYIEETGCSLEQYLELYQSYRKMLLQLKGNEHLDYPYTVASTWSLSFQKVETANAAAADLLRLCAFLHPDAISEAMLTEGASALDPQLQSVVTDLFALNEAIKELRRFSLVRRHPETKMLSLHRLVQVVLKDSMDAEMQRQWAMRTVQTISAAFPEATVDNWSRCQQCLPHAQICAELIEEHQLFFPEAALLLMHAGWYMHERGLYTQSETFLKRALTIQEQVIGIDHPDFAETLNHLAYLYYLQSRYEKAEPLYLQALAIRERTQGSEHAKTGQTIDDLAYLYHLQGRYQEAEPLFLRALTIRERTDGPDHPDTALTLNNLATLYSAQGRYQEAEPHYQRALAIRERVLGPDDPNTAQTLNNLAVLYRFQSRYEEAEPLFQRALLIYERFFGAEHPYTATALDNLATAYYRQGKYDQAEPLFQRALSIREQALGPEHHYTAISFIHLGLLYHKQGKYEQAESLLQRALIASERVLGLEHPLVATALDHLALVYQDQKHYKQAETFYQRALAIRESALGSEHPDTLALRKRYTALLELMSRT